MEPMDTPVKPAMMARLRNSRGFSLIEMAVVLVIIGIIIGAIIKGQDLIANANAKKVISAASTWRNLTVTFLDRNGRFPGDENRNGIIGDQAAAVGPPAVLEEQTEPLNAIGELVPVMESAPANPFVVGSTSFWVYIGNTTTTNSGTRNAILICGDAACANVFSADQLEIIKAMDTAYDDTADAGRGIFRAVTVAPTLLPAPPVAANAVNGRMSATFTGAGVASTVNTTAGTATAWATTHRAAVWLFDKPY